MCYTLLKEIWSLPLPVPTDKPSFVAARNVLIILGSLFRHLVLPYVQVTLSLHEQLTHLSAAAHLAAFLFTSTGLMEQEQQQEQQQSRQQRKYLPPDDYTTTS